MQERILTNLVPKLCQSCHCLLSYVELSTSGFISVTRPGSKEAGNFSEETRPNGVSIAATVAEIWPF